MSDVTNTQNLTPTPASAWQSKSAAGHTEDVPLPSGNVAKLRRPGMEAFITAGIIPNSLLGIITEELQKAKNAKGGAVPEFDDKNIEALFADPTKLTDVMTFVDSVLVYAVVEPVVKPLPVSDDPNTPPPPREPNVLYPDMVDMEDKFYVFNYAMGGTRDLERFRGELGASVESVRSSKTVVKPTKRTGGTKKR